MKAAAFARFALAPDTPAHHLNKPRTDRQAQTGASMKPGVRTIALRKRCKDESLLFRGDADARVLDLEMEQRAFRVLLQIQAQRYPAPLRELDGIAKQVD